MACSNRQGGSWLQSPQDCLSLIMCINSICGPVSIDTLDQNSIDISTDTRPTLNQNLDQCSINTPLTTARHWSSVDWLMYWSTLDDMSLKNLSSLDQLSSNMLIKCPSSVSLGLTAVSIPGGGGTPYNGLYGEAPCESGTVPFSGFRYIKGYSRGFTRWGIQKGRQISHLGI